ncbi:MULTISPECIES: hypothetical protein [unclassified Bradyrhizobium]|uniref:hypothetical protein n=1 Tax=unclassified Bradyrhizobium TaxID=2631580 RepID=UPI0028ED2879|nr:MULTISPECIES: hypothetical protein [unclassified Bradyrhizobium]
MSSAFKALAVIFILAGAVCFVTQPAAAEDKTPPATASRPSASGPDQSSVPNAAPPASRTQTTGQSGQDQTVKEMNERERSKVEREGK